MTRSYSYPDARDWITDRWIGQTPPDYQAYFQESERCIFDQALERLSPSLDPRRAWLLDAGAGEGRLFPQFESHFAKVVMVDADPARVAEAKRAAESLGRSAKVMTRACAIEELAFPRPFDVVLCNHVIQHVATSQAPKLLGRLHALCAPTGHLLLTTSQSPLKVDHWFEGHRDGSELGGRAISRKRFDAVASGRAKGGLPTRHFAQASLLALLQTAGFHPLAVRSFHFDESAFCRFGGRDLDERMNADPEHQAEGMDLFVLAAASAPGRARRVRH
jgi:ubiquinone/menaquinone biosynthesis C-methylase UbiE